MERVMSVEEKIRRAEEIYQRRKQGEIKQTVNVSVNNKKDIKLLKKIIIQMLICIVIYLCIYMIQNSESIFSQDFINNANKILSYDTNFAELYETTKNYILNLIEPKQEEKSEIIAIGGAVEQASSILKKENETLSQEEIDIQNIKNTTTFIKPIDGIITSKYGYREVQETSSNISKNHNGTDIAANLGTKIKSATDGEVVLASLDEGGYGKYIKVQIGEVSIIYAHCNNLFVKQGDKITQGQEIAEVGSTGNSTGPHLHFEIRISEKAVDPQTILEL